MSHVGKLYNIAARMLAEAVVSTIPAVSSAECYLVSQIGAPIDEPALVHVRVGSEGDAADLDLPIHDLIRAHLADVRTLWRRVLDGSIRCW